jgi:lipid II:glycine glycyltransferase (peptidoglycan interpeptide bridge formation enzyme)
MSKGHKADIKKSNKLAMSVTELNSAQDFNCLMSIFENMHKKRKLNIDQQEFYFLIKNVKDFFIYKNVGKILIVKDRDGKIIGGIILAFQGSIIRYYKGASDPDYRHLPVLHLAIWESIQLAKKLGFNSFDFWGYNHFAKENDQVFLINRFKKGFGGNYLFYPKKMYFIYKPFRYKLFRLSKMLQTRFRKN